MVGFFLNKIIRHEKCIKKPIKIIRSVKVFIIVILITGIIKNSK